jgi:hypothetical protein
MKFRYLFRSLLLTSVLAAGTSASAAPSWVDTPWGYYGGGTLGFVDPSPSDVTRIIAENNEHDRLTYDAVIDGGGCQADYIPFWIAAYCGSQAFGGGQSGQFGSAGD